ncbi:hypothetical protein GCM10015535_36060 [Streptomyces gelaticus]|uniref:Helix-turn-helix domain-containing protein n=1 Tax=Streptomyces gelaticus TaxID=285446 RepID=A0ABQ2W0K4_9ACTN|nr:winged helix-turn-helix transcriptional regulator [Streptomyces gelaticus]GGV87063.1 hypothetical protein GCM10015535_36060 [Streptomyces gelaticus]
MILYRHDLTLGARLTYIALRYEKSMKPLEPLVLFQAELAERIGKSRSSIEKYLEELREAGYIITERRHAGTQFTFTAPFNPENDVYWEELLNELSD